MQNDGRLTFGTHPGIVRTVTSTNSYRDGNWHHMVASQGWDGMKLFVDGQLVGSRPENTSQAYNGFWRVGGDNLGSWPSRPSSDYFAGQIDEAAVYNRVLTSQEVSEHFAKGSGVAAPTAAFTFTTDELDVSVNGSTSSAPPGRTITSYSWNWGDGTAAGSGVTATHPYASGWHLHDHADGDGQPGPDGVDVEGRHRGAAAREPDGGLQHAGERPVGRLRRHDVDGGGWCHHRVVRVELR